MPATESVAAFAAPILTGVVLLYQVFAPLQIVLTRPSALIVAGSVLGAAALAGALAAVGSPLVRAVILAICAAIVIDVSTSVADVFDRAGAGRRAEIARDRQRIADIQSIKRALDDYATRIGPLPMPEQYGEATGAADFWANLWDASAVDGDSDGRPFLDFLVERGVVASVPVDPLNEPTGTRDVRGGKQYVYLVAPEKYDYEGGACEGESRGVYLLAITDLETETRRPPESIPGSGCSCLWRRNPNFFQAHFDFVVCGSFKR